MPVSPAPEPSDSSEFAHRIAVRVSDGTGEFYDRLSGEKFIPRGFNYVRLAPMSSTKPALWHATLNPGLYEPERAAAARSGVYGPESLAEDGFIHCSLPEQLITVANALYRGRQDVILLVIDPSRVPAEIRFEDCYESGQEFPHIYGPLPVEAVERQVAFEPGADGAFAWPPALNHSG
jgi:uncharacterized protein (DUF952 family)